MGSCLSSSAGEQYEDTNYSIGICSMRGARRTNEDSHSVHIPIPNHPKYSFVAIFDGFNGNNASQYLSNELINVLNNLQHLTHNNLIINAINQMDQQFLKLRDISKAGSTIVFALIKLFEHSSNYIPENSSINAENDEENAMLSPTQQYEVRIFWVGDSRCILIKNNITQYDALTSDHHCDVEDEKKRITQQYGDTCIINNKVNGITELSRSFGCYSMKNNDKLKYTQQKHICIADCSNSVCESGNILLLYSDGLTERWSEETVLAKYRHHYNQCKDYKDAMQNSLTYLSEECIDHGSTDNVTIIGVKFK
eukprot:253983_1